MKNKHFGFTLIELLVVIVIIGILATISTATFKSYFGKARDAERQSAVQNMALMVKVDGADEWTDGKYVYTTPALLKALFDANDFRVPKGTNNICYYIGMTPGENTTLGDDNEFVFATWGESTSTVTTGSPGVLADGTQAAVTAITTGALVVANFDCGTGDVGMEAVTTVFETVYGADTIEGPLFINDTGDIVDDLTP